MHSDTTKKAMASCELRGTKLALNYGLKPSTFESKLDLFIKQSSCLLLMQAPPFPKAAVNGSFALK